MKKRVLAVMLVAFSVFMTACGSSENQDVESVAEESTIQEEVVVEAEESEEVSVEEVVEEVSEEEVSAEEVQENKGSYYPGVYTETGYESEYLGFRYTTPEGCTLASEEEMQQAFSEGQELLSEDFNEIQLAYADIVSINEMMVTDSTGIVNANITLEKTVVDIDTYVEAFKSQVANLSGMNVEIVNEEDAELAGAAYKKLTAEVEAEGFAMLQEYYLRKQDDRVIAIVVTWMEGLESQKENLLSGFAAY